MTPNGSVNGQPGAKPFSLSHDAWGRLVLTDAGGIQHAGVELIRAFPLSDPRHGISICDNHGRELVWIDKLDDLPSTLIEQIEDELAKREFVPVIRRVLRVSAPVEPSEWEIETDRGRTSFVLNSEDDVCEMEGNRALVTDAHGIRYLIPDIEQLDAHSRRLLERYL
ncbi:MAG TPA: DUF1854 domain-containing protein [Gemmataceae bacterium]|jgi:hypothetical protein